MERLNDDGQWIVLMGFLVSVAIFFLAFIISQSTLVGQTTSEAVLEFPKSEIQDLRSEVIGFSGDGSIDQDSLKKDISLLAINRLNAVVDFSLTDSENGVDMIIHFNNGVTEYNEKYTLL